MLSVVLRVQFIRCAHTQPANFALFSCPPLAAARTPCAPPPALHRTDAEMEVDAAPAADAAALPQARGLGAGAALWHDEAANTQKIYVDRQFFASYEDQVSALTDSRTVYVGNLSFYTTDAQIVELCSRTGPVKKVIMGLNRHTKEPCGFCFVEHYSAEAVQCGVPLFQLLTSRHRRGPRRSARWRGGGRSLTFGAMARRRTRHSLTARRRSTRSRASRASSSTTGRCARSWTSASATGASACGVLFNRNIRR